tara:strand:+ start:28 stop:204 length:177 start_codon:yes stop_codon:yes gene_type:complete
MVSCVVVRLVAVATGQCLLEFRICGFRLGVLVETVLVHVHVTDVNTTQVLVVDIITLR